MRHLYIVRHCKAEGQPPEAPLTPAGRAQAESLADFLAPLHPDHVVSSPFVRAVQTITPLAQRLALPVQVDARLGEKVLTTAPLDDWFDCLRRSYDDPDLCFEGGESSRTAATRAAAAVDAVLATGAGAPVIVTHGTLMSLLLQRFDPSFGFEAWQRLANPDVYRVTLGGDDAGARVERIWR